MSEKHTREPWGVRTPGAGPPGKADDAHSRPSHRVFDGVFTGLTIFVMVVIILLALVLLRPVRAAAQEVRPASSTTITIGGFISGTLYAQSQPFGLFTQGQAANTAPATELTEDSWFHGGDVRNTRLSIGFARTGEEWSTGARFEIDLFGGFAGTEAFGDEMPIPRLRLAYADLTRGATTVRIGQDWAPILGAVPASLSHIAFPLGYGSGGVIGWRFPGLYLIHAPDADGGVDWNVKLAAMAGSWVHLPGVTRPDVPSPGEAGLFPQLQARLNLAGGTDDASWNVYVVGHVDQKDENGIGVAGGDALFGRAVQVGGRFEPGPITLQGNVYYGQAIGHLLGALTQPGDIVGVGGWGQIGYRFAPRLSAWAFLGFDDARDGDVVVPEGGRDANRILAGMLRYDLPGYALGLEWLQASTDYVGSDEATSATQLAMSVFYSF